MGGPRGGASIGGGPAGGGSAPGGGPMGGGSTPGGGPTGGGSAPPPCRQTVGNEQAGVPARGRRREGSARGGSPAVALLPRPPLPQSGQAPPLGDRPLPLKLCTGACFLSFAAGVEEQGAGWLMTQVERCSAVDKIPAKRCHNKWRKQRKEGGVWARHQAQHTTEGREDGQTARNGGHQDQGKCRSVCCKILCGFCQRPAARPITSSFRPAGRRHGAQGRRKGGVHEGGAPP